MKSLKAIQSGFTWMLSGGLAILSVSPSSFAGNPRSLKSPEVVLFVNESESFYAPSCSEERKLKVQALIKSKAVLRNGEFVEDAMRFRKRLEDLWPKITAGLSAETVQNLGSVFLSYSPEWDGGTVVYDGGRFLSPPPHSETDAELVQKARKALAKNYLNKYFALGARVQAYKTAGQENALTAEEFQELRQLPGEISAKELTGESADQEKARLKVVQEKYNKLVDAAHGAYKETKDRYQRIGEELDPPAPSALAD